ncbi:MAG: purine-nucleoside phosphorylase [Treponema sp. GWB1_62_6]|nr:MAG: purine-nucleoside phosphorylase [Treponema sp. GWA1_62_8]OHE66418.1 MAG: purine-nucleoside phosphorylase [Treponema sp. GWC1_61_84]OHE66851.1 MAG: purine-nucleoside phosphorylase [Treponema sp. GWB1_62_6]OHE74278.1 MAG: purine-nucleoside phosphorylase [Treponema sp. RIFOXYC1_FULL_61_9]HCM27831.1 purine-nucleoside phosphorylase [Treponema sp.]
MHHLYAHDAGTPHNAAVPGEIAPFVLMPGDPLRAKFVAENYLEGAVQVTSVRGMLGFTGTFRGKPVSVMGSGMGAPSMGIYSYELYSHYGVERIVRIGTCGGLTAEVEVGDLLFAMSASTDSSYAAQYELPGTFSPCADYGLLEKAVAAARAKSFRYWTGNIFSSDVFSLYSARGDEGWKKWARMGCAGTDMECYALYCNAAYLGKKALTLLTCSDSNVTRKELTALERQTMLVSMFETALELIP